jgi:hypothetical protein
MIFSGAEKPCNTPATDSQSCNGKALQIDVHQHATLYKKCTMYADDLMTRLRAGDNRPGRQAES